MNANDPLGHGEHNEIRMPTEGVQKAEEKENRRKGDKEKGKKK